MTALKNPVIKVVKTVTAVTEGGCGQFHLIKLGVDCSVSKEAPNVFGVNFSIGMASFSKLCRRKCWKKRAVLKCIVRSNCCPFVCPFSS